MRTSLAPANFVFCASAAFGATRIALTMALVAHDSHALVQIPPAKGKPYILSFGKTQYLVPHSAIKLFPKKSNEVPDGKVLGSILATKAPEKWLEYCKPDTLCHIEVDDMSCVYTTFNVPEHPEECRFLRFISGTIADKNFPILAAEIDKKIEKGDITLSNDRQRARREVLNWKKETNCPNRAQISPELNKWTALDKEENVKSCRIEPETKKRQLKVHGASGALSGAIGKNGHGAQKSVRFHVQPEDVVEWEMAYCMGPKGTYNVHEIGNVLRIVQYKHSDGVVEANTTEVADAADARSTEPTTNGRQHAEDEDDEDENDL